MALGACPGCCVSSHSVSPSARTIHLPVSTEYGRWSWKEMSRWYSCPRAVTLITTNWMASNLGIYSLQLSPGGWKSKTKAPAGPRSFCRFQGGSFLLFQLLGAPGASQLVAPLLPSLPPLLHGSSLCVCVPSSLFL